MPVKSESQNVLTREIKIIPGWAWVLAGIAFVAAQIFFNFVVRHHHEHHPPTWALPIMGVLAGIGAGCFLLLIGYINRDAKRRGMSRLLWTIMAVIIPNALGIILYFLLRQPLQSMCPQCGNVVQAGFSFCPRCSYKLSPSCPRCQRGVGAQDAYCPYCGAGLGSEPTGAGAETRVQG